MNIESWAYRNLNNIHPTPSGDDLITDCPFCEARVGKYGPSHHLSISLTKPVCHCYRCDYAASWIKLVMDVEGCDYSDALELIHSAAIMPLYQLLQKSKSPGTVMWMPEWFMTIQQALDMDGLTHRLAIQAYKYAQLRIGNLENWKRYLEQWGIWNSAKGWGRLVMPVERGWWQYRHIHNGVKPKYVSCPAPKNDRVYNYPALNRSTVYICEGIISAIHVGQDAIALCGKTATPQQLERIGNSVVKQFIICVEPDAVEAARKLAEQLHRYNKSVILRIYSDGDPASSHTYTDYPMDSKMSHIRSILTM